MSRTPIVFVLSAAIVLAACSKDETRDATIRAKPLERTGVIEFDGRQFPLMSLEAAEARVEPIDVLGVIVDERVVTLLFEREPCQSPASVEATADGDTLALELLVATDLSRGCDSEGVPSAVMVELDTEVAGLTLVDSEGEPLPQS